MQCKQYVVDAFTDEVFHGNPAAVCVADHALPEELMQQIAIENNLSETAFPVKEGSGYHLRWFTPGGEIDLCGHATLATAWVLLHFYEPEAERVIFRTMSGPLTVTRQGDRYAMDFPAYALQAVPVTPAMTAALGAEPKEAWLGRDLLCVFDDPATVETMQPDQEALLKLDGLLVNVTAPGREENCVSRSFGPKCAVPEDPVCGSGHCHIAPYWAKRLGKETLQARQASHRGGRLLCRVQGERVTLSGRAVLYSVGEIYV